MSRLDINLLMRPRVFSTTSDDHQTGNGYTCMSVDLCRGHIYSCSIGLFFYHDYRSYETFVKLQGMHDRKTYASLN